MPELSVVICSLDGAPGVARALRSLRGQLPDGDLEVIVVDDGSTDDTAAVAARGGATVVRHPVNRGLAAARNSGVAASTAPVVAFIDDDCEAHPGWARGILAGYEDDVAGVGGPVVVGGGDGFVIDYLRRHNPLQQLEMELARGDGAALRLWLYLRRQWSEPRHADVRDVFALVGASMSFRREVLEEAGGFDERFRFGAEELELCHRVRRLPRPGVRLVFQRGAAVTHHFEPSLRDTLRRSRSYGRGAARFRARWPEVNPTVFPAPLVAAGLLALAVRHPWARVAAVIAPQVMLPSGLRAAVRERRPVALLDAYVELLQEAASDWGFARGWWEFRDLGGTPAPVAAPLAEAVP